MNREPNETISDEALACRAQQGCAESLDRLLRRFQTPVLYFLQRRGSVVDAVDIAQETFLRAYENLHRYDGRRRFSTWLFTIARRTSLNHRRRQHPAADAKAVEAAPASGGEPLDTIVAEESRTRLWDRAARILSEEQATALWLHYVEEMPAREIALVLERSWASVKVMLFRARKQLVPLLAEFDERQSGKQPFDSRSNENQPTPFQIGRPKAVELEVPHV